MFGIISVILDFFTFLTLIYSLQIYFFSYFLCLPVYGLKLIFLICKILDYSYNIFISGFFLFDFVNLYTILLIFCLFYAYKNTRFFNHFNYSLIIF